MSKEPKDLFRATLVKSEFSDEVTLDVYMNENSLSNLTLEQIEKVYIALTLTAQENTLKPIEIVIRLVL